MASRTSRVVFSRCVPPSTVTTTPSTPPDALVDADVYGALHPPNANEDVMPLFERVWAVMNALPDDHPLHLPPIYSDEPEVRMLLPTLAREFVRRDGELQRHDGGHIVIGGVEGTGKSAVCIDGVQATAASLRTLDGKYCRWSREIGIDSVAFKFDSNDTLVLSGWQCKVGHRQKGKFGEGDVLMYRTRLREAHVD